MKNSFEKNKKGIMLMIISSICACIGQLFWKLSITNGIWILFLGFSFYGLGALAMLIAYKFGNLSVLQPMLSINYILSIFLARIFLNENITMIRITGIIIIIIGVILIGVGDE
ncbi:MAG: EamA family transporter [Fusobacteriaceae bacterium]|nr:EamA family transporter [Fusobacteriaceae bacterium]